MTQKSTNAVSTLLEVAQHPERYSESWKREHGRKVIGVLPMNFPTELVAASGALPVVVQDRQEPITVGNNLLTEFYCGYTRSLADQAAKGQLDHFDAFLNADHCIQLLGAADVLRMERPEKPVFFEHLIAALDDEWTHRQVGEKVDSFIEEIERITGSAPSDEALREAIRTANENRQLLRSLFDARRNGDARFTPRQLQAFVKSSMVMDKAEHTALLRQALAETPDAVPRDARIRLHLSGHFCHAPRVELFDLFEECGAIIVDDDLYFGVRYVSTDVSEDKPPRRALGEWYFDRNRNIPCPTRVQASVDWDRYLDRSVAVSGAEGVIVLMAKFCEPHMFHYPELRKSLDRHGVPHLLIETEHEGIPVETLRTRIEAMLERIRRKKSSTSGQPHAAPAPSSVEMQEH